ncbi:MAG: hypothetical protein GXO91_10005 [FCB group bacterium]|nr:hypothetical protein [FCB group bacterium]
MKSIKLAFGYGFLLWLIPFIIAFLIYPLKEVGSPMFETIMPLVLTFCCMIFTYRYFRSCHADYLSEGLKLGFLWFGISLVIDLVMFSRGPMQMPFLDYMADIGFTYLIFPIITVGAAHLLADRP